MPTFEVHFIDRKGARQKAVVEATDKYDAQSGFTKGSIQMLRQIPAEPEDISDPDTADVDAEDDTDPDPDLAA